jgi:hypothetical protein
MSVLLELLFEVFVEIVVEVLLELGFTSVKEALGRENRHPVLSTIGYLILGSALGGLSLLYWPERILGTGPVSGLSLVFGPALSGATMHVWGELRRAGGHQTTNLATFYGGFAFALGVALVRFLWLR